MRSLFTRRESFLAALAAFFAPVFAGRPARASQPSPTTNIRRETDGAAADTPAPTVTYRYDEHGRLLSVTNPAGAQERSSWSY